MWIEDQLKSIIEKAAQDFDETISSERKVPSAEDGTLRGEFLDRILDAQKEQRNQLWKRLHELEDQCKAEGRHKLYETRQDPEHKRLSVLRHEEHELSKEIRNQLDAINVVVRPEETIAELQLKEMLCKVVDGLRQARNILDKELADASNALTREQMVLNECHEIHEVLTRKLEEAQRPDARLRAVKEYREKIANLTVKQRDVLNDLTDFVDHYFPPHPVDQVEGHNEDTDTCELKFILEDLMNIAYLKPDDPYLQLTSGTYWSPYIETLVKAGIAVRHPEDSSKIRLADFSL